MQSGRSCQTAYRVTSREGVRYFLRIMPEEESAGCRERFRMQKAAAASGVPVCQPVEMGECEEGVYILQSWIEGEKVETALPSLSDAEQYACGLEAGRILKALHALPVPEDMPDGEARWNARIDRLLEACRGCPARLEGAEQLFTYIEANRSLLKGRPRRFQHGAYHTGSLMLENGRLAAVGFERCGYGDPWEDFGCMARIVKVSPRFASGLVNGYFTNGVPLLFWKLLALYSAYRALSGLLQPLSSGGGAAEAADILGWHDGMRSPIPSWYFKGYYLQTIDGRPYKLKAPFDFSFLASYGRVFKVFDDQDSGNICFGTEREGQRYFIKFAGAPTEAYDGTAEDAVRRLKAALPVYRDLSGSGLEQFVQAEETGGGYALIFRWAQGSCMGRAYPAAHRRFMSLPVKARLKVFRDILVFLEHVHACGYVAVDFYDGSILYDFETDKTTVCDIDFFRKKPCINDMGRMWGSGRFMSPEEYRLGAELNERTNVYTAGAFAFALFGGYSRSRDRWPLGEASYQAAAKATAEDPGGRQPSIRQFRKEWEKAFR